MIATGRRDKQKWNKDLIRQLYFSGYDIPEIIKLEMFKTLSPNYLQKMVYQERWHEQRKELREQAKALGDIQLVDMFKKQGDEHYRFMIEQLEKHREIIRKREISDSLKGQKEHVALLNDYDTLARRTLGLNEQDNPKDRGTMAIKAMILIQQNGPLKAPNVASAIDVLPGDQNDSTGILDAKNGIYNEASGSILTQKNGTYVIEGTAENDQEENETTASDEAGGWSGEIKGKGE